jgi:hypothetical protein
MGLFDSILPSLFSAGNQVKKNVRGLLADPVGQSNNLARSVSDNLQGLLGPLAGIQAETARGQGVLGSDPALQQAARDRQVAAVSNFLAPMATVWHGSPHKFGKFDSSKIGTGEGAQAYGHGLYLAESPDVAGRYQRALADKVQRGRAIADAAGKEIPIGNTIDADALAALDMVSAGKALPKNHASLFSKAIAEQDKIARTATDPNAVARAAQVKQRLLDLKNSGARLFDEQSNLYKVDLPDDAIAKMLDWDKPLRKQSPEVRAAIAEYEKMLKDAGMVDPNGDTSGLLGKGFYESLGYAMRGKAIEKNDIAQTTQRAMQENASRALKAAGIPGLRYLDGGSRGAGAGTSNYVVFPGNEGLLTILERNGKPIAEAQRAQAMDMAMNALTAGPVHGLLGLGSRELNALPESALRDVPEEVLRKLITQQEKAGQATGHFRGEIARRNAVSQLGLPEANTAADRARAMGHTIDAYHGSSNTGITEFLPQGGRDGWESALDKYRSAQFNEAPFGYMNFRDGSFFGTNPSTANGYTAENTGVVYPTRLRVNKPLRLVSEGNGRHSVVPPSKPPPLDALVINGNPGQGIANADEIAVIDPRQVRSRFAAFDPAKAKSHNLLAGYVGGLLTLNGLLSGPEDR